MNLDKRENQATAGWKIPALRIIGGRNTLEDL